MLKKHQKTRLKYKVSQDQKVKNKTAKLKKFIGVK